MKNVIVTGADGFVGSYTADHFHRQGIKLLALDLAKEPRRLKPGGGLRYASCNVTDTDALLTCIPKDTYDTFIHFAWAGSSGTERMDYALQMQNALDTVACMKTAKALGCRRFVCAGSIMEYEVEAAVHAQGTRPGMAYIYGMGKHIAHSLCKSVAADIGIELLWPMITNAYGVGETSVRFVNSTLRKMIQKQPLEFTAATQNYDFVYITDVAEAFYLIALRGKPFCEYIIGSGDPKPLKEFILEMQQSCAPDMQLHFGNVPFTGTNLPISVFNTDDIATDCGYKPSVSFAQGTKMTMNWLQALDEGGIQ